VDRRQQIIPLGDMNGIYIISEEGRVSFSILPNNEDALSLDKINEDPLVQISCTGDSSGLGFSAGETRHNSGLTMDMKYESIDVKEDGDEKTVTTATKSDNGLVARHVVKFTQGSRGVRVHTEVLNEGKEPVMIEALSSVNITGITPYTDDVARDRIVLHRYRSRWSAEGRHETRTIEELLLEPSWANFGFRCEKFGCLGSMPIRGFFPFAAIEDVGANVMWAISLACSSSWQFEITRSDSNLNLTCGLADFEFGHWRKELRPGEVFTSPEAYITAVAGGLTDVGSVETKLIDKACDRLLDVQRSKLLSHQRVSELPAIFNEYCTTWGEPSEQRIKELLSVIKGSDFKYFVIDAGWYADEITGWQDNMGDWNVAKDLFPNGMKPVVEMINQAGMEAGIWFELETVGKDSNMVDDTPHLLTRDGKVVISGTRRFWDMRQTWVEEYLTEKVIDFLNDNGFKYIKIDYNDTIGMGCDGAESYGEGLRQCVEATKSFFRKIRKCVPDIAIEICSSGGHRLEPSFMELGDFLSFSDAHEEREIPVIAADLQNLILAQKSQIWAVLRKDDEPKRIAYSVCAGMYGVLCISGDVEGLSKEKWKLAIDGVSFYKKVSPIIVSGITKRFGPFQNSNRALKDYQASVRYFENKALVLVHSFEHESVQQIQIPLDGKYRICDIYEAGDHGVSIEGNNMVVSFKESFDALAVLIER